MNERYPENHPIVSNKVIFWKTIMLACAALVVAGAHSLRESNEREQSSSESVK